MTTFQDRPIVDGKEQRYRWELRRVDHEARVYRFVHDLRTFYEAVLYSDTAVTMLGGDFVVWDNVEKKVAHDSRGIKRPPAANDEAGGR